MYTDSVWCMRPPAGIRRLLAATCPPAQRLIVHPLGVVRCMLAKRQLPEAAPNLVAALSHLNCYQLTGHGEALEKGPRREGARDWRGPPQQKPNPNALLVASCAYKA